MDSFDLLGPLPAPGTTTVLEASAGTGKTFALAGLVTRYIAEGIATLDEMLLITFSRAASRELRERVRGQIVEIVAALCGSPDDAPNTFVAYLCRGSAAERDQRCNRLRDALANFDAATIATTHQFCQLVLRSLGVAGDTDAGVTLVESLDDLVTRIVDDLYLVHFGSDRDEAALTHADALKLARAVVADPCAELRPEDPDPESVAAVRLRFARDVLDQLKVRKRRLGILSYDDLLTRLADALEDDDSDARDRMRTRWPIVMVDEFQDTDPIQWQVIDRAFNGHCTLVLIGDPKQAIYGFRGGDIYTYLRAARTAAQQCTLSVNWRSDKVLVDSLQTVLRGAALGDPDIVVRDVEAHVTEHRLHNAPRNAPFRLRLLTRAMFGRSGTATIPIAALRDYIPADLAADIGALLASDATFDGNPVQAGDVAVIVERSDDALACQKALAAAGIQAVYTGDADVFASDAAKDWLCLLEAFDQTHRDGLVRAAGATVFFGHTADDLAAGGDELTERLAATLRDWADHLRARGPAAVFEAAQIAGLGRRVLGEPGGERTMTDLAHIAQLLHEVAHRQRLTLPALRDWLRRQREERDGPQERNRRIDSDAAAVQIMTVWGAKGLQFPIVYLPFAFNRHVFVDEIPLFHDDGVRRLHVGGPESADRLDIAALSRAEAARNDIRLTYVALTRAQSQVVTWWAPAWDEPNGGLSRLLRGRRIGEAQVPDSCEPKTISDDAALALMREWEAAGGPVIEEPSVTGVAPVPPPAPPTDLEVRHFHRSIDTTWRRTSYSALIRGVEATGVSSEAEVTARDDEVEVVPAGAPGDAGVPSPMAELPSGATFGSLVHAVLENADPSAVDLAAELEAQVRLHSTWWPVDAEPAALAAALVPMHDTQLGPLAAGLTLRQIEVADRLRELDFEIPVAGGDARDPRLDVRLCDVGALLRDYLPADDPFARYGERLVSDGLGGQLLRGYLSGSIDVVLRLPGHRYLIVDYKTNFLGVTAADYSPPRLTEAMLHSDYPLQALLYLVVLHRFLRWRQPGYDPSAHLGGVLYLFVRGMCGVDSPGAGVFSWQPPAGLVPALSDLLDEGRQPA
ncbi:exodeoxyribonuclease V subunit beta [Mycobacterium celatum]|uniref:RecBCD enzyme subunit RecB n=1 Tax=Mycobacterium celatum TaxID=28045 RepID=A0A1X1RSV6_MYCCE|nr:exodeoxyribonuclease V subunit beta [Mycobacterium celatum]ORV14858.1 exodeoxyribonuclease V subunit beta [Mycobacterium celatum]PIB80110.1 exodeoxyribonuclease V subunit beta [Mycobacterium celatum]